MNSMGVVNDEFFYVQRCDGLSNVIRIGELDHFSN
jgi:hypothetical protein